MSKEDREKIIELYFKRMYSIEELEIYFNYKYTEQQIWGALETKWKD